MTTPCRKARHLLVYKQRIKQSRMSSHVDDETLTDTSCVVVILKKEEETLNGDERASAGQVARSRNREHLLG